MLNEWVRLYKMGFAIHWIKEGSKAPVRSGWTKGPREDLETLRRSYVKGYNVGVRLGSASQVGDGYLAVLDCDLKSSDSRHKDEMLEAITQIMPEWDFVPQTASGRANGSMHIWALTEAPVKGRDLVRSRDMVKVRIKSAKPSKRERESLSRDELQEGVRLRRAWEISFMSEGRQVVLPPSVHPDTGRKYEWVVPVGNAGQLPFFTPPVEVVEVKESDKISPKIEGFVEYDVETSKLPEKLKRKIIDGDGVDDRSAALLSVSMSLFRRGLSHEEIVSILTDQNYFLGEAAFEHAQTSDRRRAANWLSRYTLAKAKHETVADEAFRDSVIVEEIPLGDDEAKEQEDSIKSLSDWQSGFERSGKDGSGPPKPTLKNTVLVLENALKRGFLKYDLFSNRAAYSEKTPWGSEKGASFSDPCVSRMKYWMACHFRFEPNDKAIMDAAMEISRREQFHPVRDYLERLEWDGVARVDTTLKRYIEAVAPEPYLSDVSRKLLVAMIARVYEPGVKFDYMPILEGIQGVGKSTFARILASDDWFLDELPDIRDKDAVMNLQGIWLVEMGELKNLRYSEVETIKAFVSRQYDRVRPHFGRMRMDFPRQCVFLGTTNSDEYLKDKTGNRRFWPVEVGQCDFKALIRDRDQILAEAKWIYDNLREPLYLDNPDSESQAKNLQAGRVQDDESTLMQEMIFEYLEKKKANPECDEIDLDRFKIRDLFNDAIDGGVIPNPPLARWKMTSGNARFAGEALRSLGFENYRVSSGKFWRKQSQNDNEP